MCSLCMSGGGQFVDRNEVALVETPTGTDSWKPAGRPLMASVFIWAMTVSCAAAGWNRPMVSCT